MRTHRLMLLAAEKDKAIREVASYFSKAKDFEVLFVQNGLEAIDATKELLPDIIVMELLLPKLDGIRVCKALKENENTSHIPIVIISLIPAEKKSFEAGADVFLLKPINSSVLIATIEKYFAKNSIA